MVKKDEIVEAQASWGRAVVGVGKSASWEEAHGLAVKLVGTHYLLEDGSLLFSPTRAKKNQFRRTLEEAVSYFVGTASGDSEDGGFALEPWSAIRFENVDIECRGDTGIAMGNYYFGREDGSELRAEYSFVYVLNSEGELKIQLHHSAVPHEG